MLLRSSAGPVISIFKYFNHFSHLLLSGLSCPVSVLAYGGSLLTSSQVLTPSVCSHSSQSHFLILESGPGTLMEPLPSAGPVVQTPCSGLEVPGGWGSTSSPILSHTWLPPCGLPQACLCFHYSLCLEPCFPRSSF